MLLHQRVHQCLVVCISVILAGPDNIMPIPVNSLEGATWWYVNSIISFSFINRSLYEKMLPLINYLLTSGIVNVEKATCLIFPPLIISVQDNEFVPITLQE